jgi:hypothetical protein
MPKMVSLADDDISPIEYVICANIARRHLTAEQKLSIVAELIRAKPEASSLQIAKLAKASPTTVVKVRHKLEAAGDVSTAETSTDPKGRKQPRVKPRKAKTTEKVSSAKIEEQQLDSICANADFSPPAEAETPATNEPASNIPIPEPIAQGGQDETESDHAAGVDRVDHQGDYEHHDDERDYGDDHRDGDDHHDSERDQPVAATEAIGTGTDSASDQDAGRHALDPADFLNASPEERAAYVELLGLGAFIDALPETKVDEPGPLNDEHFKRISRLISGALKYVQANDASNAIEALRGALRVLSSQGRNVDDLAVALGATLKAKQRSRPTPRTFHKTRTASRQGRGMH